MDDAPIEIHIAPNLDECTRVGLRAIFRTPRAVLMSAGVLIMSIGLLLFAFGGGSTSPTDYGIVSTVIACAIVLPAAFFFWVRFDIRRKLKVSIDGKSSTILAYSNDTIELRFPRGSARLDWKSVKWARRIPEGVLVFLGGPQFYSRTYFAKGEFDRFLELLRNKLGPKANV